MKRAIGFAFCALALAGCAGAPAPAPTVTVTATMETTVTAAPTPTPTPTAAAQMGMGDSVEIAGRIKFTLVEHRTGDWAGDPNQGFLVEACSLTETLRVSGAAWMGVSATGGRYQAVLLSGDRNYEPSYPDGDDPRSELAAGECLRGWVVFSTGDQMSEVRYNSQSGAAVWKLV